VKPKTTYKAPLKAIEGGASQASALSFQPAARPSFKTIAPGASQDDAQSRTTLKSSSHVVGVEPSSVLMQVAQPEDTSDDEDDIVINDVDEASNEELCATRKTEKSFSISN